MSSPTPNYHHYSIPSSALPEQTVNIIEQEKAKISAQLERQERTNVERIFSGTSIKIILPSGETIEFYPDEIIDFIPHNYESYTVEFTRNINQVYTLPAPAPRDPSQPQPRVAYDYCDDDDDYDDSVSGPYGAYPGNTMGDL